LLAESVLKPRPLMAQPWEPFSATSKLSAKRRASGRLEEPERRISSFVRTWIAAGACQKGSGSFETEVTSKFIKSSKLSFFKSVGVGLASWAKRGNGPRAKKSVAGRIKNKLLF